MKKVFLFSFVIILFVSLSVPVFGSESIHFLYEPDSDYSSFSPGTISPGLYDYTVTFYGYTDGQYTPISFSGTGNFILVHEDGQSLVIFPFLIPDSSSSITFIFVDLSNFGNPGFTSSGILFEESITIPVSLDLVRHHNPDFISSVNTGLSSVVSWIQSFSIAFLSGDLSPLLTVFILGICICLLFLTVRFIYKVCWGC